MAPYNDFVIPLYFIASVFIASSAQAECSLSSAVRQLASETPTWKTATGLSLSPEQTRSYLRLNTDAFTIRKIEPGRHGGNRLTVERSGTWHDNRKEFAPGGGDVTQDLRLWPRVFGEKGAEFFGFKVRSARRAMIPDETELIGAIRKFNEGLPPDAPERIAMNFYPTRASFERSERFVRRFALTGELPISTNARNFYHDISSHSMEGFFLHPEFYSVMRERAKLWTEFVDNEARVRPANAAQLAKADRVVSDFLTTEIDQSANLMGSFISKSDQRYLNKVGIEIALKEAARASKSNPPPISMGRATLKSFSPHANLIKLVSRPPLHFFQPLLKSEAPEFVNAFELFVRDRAKRDPATYKQMSFDWESDLRWLNTNSARLIRGESQLLPELADLELTRPFFLRIKRLREMN